MSADKIGTVMRLRLWTWFFCQAAKVPSGDQSVRSCQANVDKLGFAIGYYNRFGFEIGGAVLVS